MGKPGGKEPGEGNAAVRYLLALSYLPPLSEQAERALVLCRSAKDLARLPAETRAWLADPGLQRAARLAVAAGACPACEFAPDNRDRHDDVPPPLRRLWIFARALNAAGWQAQERGHLPDALDRFETVFRLGQHLEASGFFYAGTLSFAIRHDLAITSIHGLLVDHPAGGWQERVRRFFAAVPRPAMDARRILQRERRRLESGLQAARHDPGLLTTLFDSPDETGGDQVAARRQAERIVQSGRLPELAGEVLAVFDEGLALQPRRRAFAEASRTFWNDVRSSANPLVRLLVPNIGILLEQAVFLQADIDDLAG